MPPSLSNRRDSPNAAPTSGMEHSVHVDSAESQQSSGRRSDSPFRPWRSIGVPAAPTRSAASRHARFDGSIASTRLACSGLLYQPTRFRPQAQGPPDRASSCMLGPYALPLGVGGSATDASRLSAGSGAKAVESRIEVMDEPTLGAALRHDRSTRRVTVDEHPVPLDLDVCQFSAAGRTGHRKS